MKRKGILLTAMGLLLTLSIAAQVLPPGLNTNAGQSPLMALSQPVSHTTPQRVISDNSLNGMTVTYHFNGFNIAQKQHQEAGRSEAFQFIHIDGFSKMGETGKPALPAHNDVIILPSDAYSIQIIEAPYTDYQGFNIYPAPEAASDEAGIAEPPFVMDDQTYNTNAFFPASLVKVVEVQKIRGVNFGVFQIRPMQFNPVTHTLRVYSAIKYRIVFNGLNPSLQNLKFNSSDHFLRTFKHAALNANLLPKRNEASTKSTSYNIILLTTPTYQAAADTLAKWKRQMGYSVYVISRSSWTSTAVKDSVHNLYQSWSPKPDYLIILGDQADVPAESITYSSTYYLTDLYYVCMDGSGDYFPDMAHGRISVASASQAMTVVQKIVNYERNPVSNASFYSNALASTYFQDGSSYTSYHDGYADRRFTHTTEEIRDYLMAHNYSVQRVYSAFDNRTPTYYNNGFYSTGGSIPSDLLVSNGFQWNGSATDIINAINAGRFLVFHRDHGYIDGYGWEHPYFLDDEANALVSNGDHIDQLTNGDKLPVVFSVNCHTGDFKRPECFAENFLRKANGGAVGVIAPSYSSYSGYNDALADGMIDAIWSNPGLVPAFGSGGTTNPSLNSHGDIYAMGDVLVQGLLRMTQTWASSTKWQMQHETYNYFGDPSMKIWTANPQTISISGLDSLIRLDSALTLSSSNLSEAMVTLMVNDQVVAKGMMTNGNISLPFDISGDVMATLTITAHNYRPLIRHIHINNIIKPSPPQLQASNIHVVNSNSKSASLTIAWDKGDGDFDLVKISDDGTFTAPVNGQEYAANSGYNGSGEQVVFSGMGNSVNITNLNENTTYWIRVYEYNNEGVYTLYLTATDVANPTTTDGGGTLPVSYVEFSASIKEGKVLLNWATASEMNNQRFAIERSADDQNFSVVGGVPGYGNSNIMLRYHFTDEDPLNGLNYYRLAQYDYDGRVHYSKTIAVKVSGATPASIHHLLSVNNAIKINYSTQEDGQLLLLNTSAQLVKTFNLPGGTHETLQLSTAGLAPGLYFVTLQTPQGRQVKKIVLQ